MAPVLVAAGLLLLALPAAAGRFGPRIGSAEWGRLCAAAFLGGAVLVEVGLLLLAAPTVFRALGVPALAHVCERLVGPLVPLGSAGGWGAAVLAAVGAGAGVRGWRRADAQVRGLAIERCLGAHVPGDGYDLVVLPTAERVAYSVDHLGPQVVVSRGVFDTLTPPQVHAVIAHERAHLRLRHPRLLLAAAGVRQAVRWWPPAGRSDAVLRFALERWADDAATADAPARAHLREALVRLAAADLGAAVAAFSLADATLERIRAMERAPRAAFGLRALLYVPGLAAAVVALAVAVTWTSHVGLVLAMAGRCAI